MNRIKEVLKEKGRTQVWLCEQIDRKPNNVNRYCSNLSQPTICVLFKIAVALNVEPGELLVSTKEFKNGK